MASNLIANYMRPFFLFFLSCSNSDGLQPTSEGLHTREFSDLQIIGARQCHLCLNSLRRLCTLQLAFSLAVSLVATRSQLRWIFGRHGL